MIRFINNRNARNRFRIVLGMSLYKHWSNRTITHRRLKLMMQCMRDGKPFPSLPRRFRLVPWGPFGAMKDIAGSRSQDNTTNRERLTLIALLEVSESNPQHAVSRGFETWEIVLHKKLRRQKAGITLKRLSRIGLVREVQDNHYLAWLLTPKGEHVASVLKRQ